MSKNRAIEWTPVADEANVWFLRCGRCGVTSKRFTATGELDKANAFQETFERVHSSCPPTGHTPDAPFNVGPFKVS